jgi:hypothetical protein
LRENGSKEELGVKREEGSKEELGVKREDGSEERKRSEEEGWE